MQLNIALIASVCQSIFFERLQRLMINNPVERPKYIELMNIAVWFVIPTLKSKNWIKITLSLPCQVCDIREAMPIAGMYI